MKDLIIIASRDLNAMNVFANQLAYLYKAQVFNVLDQALSKLKRVHSWSDEDVYKMNTQVLNSFVENYAALAEDRLQEFKKLELVTEKIVLAGVTRLTEVYDLNNKGLYNIERIIILGTTNGLEHLQKCAHIVVPINTNLQVVSGLLELLDKTQSCTIVDTMGAILNAY